ncbi:AMP-binding protein [Actinomadura barringtoniae]|uniref:AMP-binding protein n=1 Tax=Actinomadura barringtoniae TaxID=1427535 RepID=A0A939T5L2_9ACTN|nr:AMP-binding protein [Actinomadura barringtoniae]MBO2447232.1 AMP-binding protein [Actinomadura barringtoniae]
MLIGHPPIAADQTTIHAVLADHAGGPPTQAALICDGWPVGYGELHRESNRAARSLRAAGAGPGTRVAYLGRETEHFYEVLFGCAKTGAVLVPIDRRTSPEEAVRGLAAAEPIVVLADEELMDVVEEAGCGGRVVPLADFASWKSILDSDLPVRSDGPLVGVWQDGAVSVLTHGGLLSAPDDLGLRPGDVSLLGTPGLRVPGLWWAMQGFRAGATVVTMRSYAAGEAGRLIARHGVTAACLDPLLAARLRGADLSALRTVVRTG